MTRRKLEPQAIIEDQAAPAPDSVGVKAAAAGDADQAPDPFDPARYRIAPEVLATAGAKPVLATVPVRKPNRQDWFRINPDLAYKLTTVLIELKDDRELFLVDPDLQQELALEGIAVELLTMINRQGIVTLWPLRLPDASGRTNAWHESARIAAAQAVREWTRMVANMSLGAYELFAAVGDLPEPEWPTEPFRDLFRIAFRGRLIDTRDHLVLKRLRGEV